MNVTRFGRFYTFGNGKTLQFVSGSIPTRYTYALSLSSTTADEGDTVVVTLTSSPSQPNGTQIPYTISGNNIYTSDFVSIPGLSGNFTLQNNTGSASLQIAEDYSTEGGEVFTLTLDNENVSASVTVNDTSIVGSGATYSLTHAGTPQSGYVGGTMEGTTVTFTLTTTNIPDGNHVSYSVSTTYSTDINSDDLDLTNSSNYPDGSFIINNNSATASFKLKSDFETEGSEYIRLSVYDVNSGTQTDIETALIYDTSLDWNLGDSGPSNTIAFTNNTSQSVYFDTQSAALEICDATHFSSSEEWPIEIQFKSGSSSTYRTSLDEVEVDDEVYYTLGNQTFQLNYQGVGAQPQVLQFYGFSSTWKGVPTHIFRVENGVVKGTFPVGYYGKLLISNSGGATWAGTSTGGAFVVNADGTIHDALTSSGGAIRSAIDSQNRVIVLNNNNTNGGFKRLNTDGTLDTVFSASHFDTVEGSSAILYNVGVDSEDNVIFGVPTNTTDSLLYYYTASLRYTPTIQGVTNWEPAARRLEKVSGSLDQTYSTSSLVPAFIQSKYTQVNHWVTLPNQEMVGIGEMNIVNYNLYPDGITGSIYAHIDSDGNFKKGSGFNFNQDFILSYGGSNPGGGTNAGIYIPQILNTDYKELLVVGGDFTSFVKNGTTYNQNGLLCLSSSGELVDLFSGSDDGFSHDDGDSYIWPTDIDFSGSHLVVTGRFHEWDNYPANGIVLFKWDNTKGQFVHDRTFNSTTGSVSTSGTKLYFNTVTFGIDGNIYAIGGNDYWNGTNYWGSAWGTVWKFDLEGNVDLTWVANAGNGYVATLAGWQKIRAFKDLV